MAVKEGFDGKVFAYTGAIFGGTLSALCGIFYALSPQSAINFFRNIFHADIQMVARPLEAQTFVFGIAEAAVLGLIIGWMFAVIYNNCLKHCRK